ncbi:membrane bound O-acyl transferase family-domain-containing protein [Emericellopsis atlantica]|uniref:Membrane bound O-acyl transferase family-domain-containing protein n=1 Tax=Emericellopsis atlantica TaxID=2614577 RepID=A0A9P7ZIJ4_9HYPO|nr:membrane bound O-acyl transferase family-domain-containing protein [Emericellopsis atlantica]KAG9252670.1 membrane bound O-acyl transferase family-domain-containing protein [Emericellopsis atlantica]
MAAAQALLLYGQATALMMGSQYIERHQRLVLLVPVWASLGLAFKDIAHIPPFMGLNVQLGMLIIITFLYCPILLASSAKTLNINQPRWDLPAAYRRFNNPRGLPAVSLGQPEAWLRRRLQFVVFGVVKVILIVASRAVVDHILTPHLATSTIHDFSPAKEWVVRRLLFGDVSARDIFIRTYVALSWIIETYSQLTLCHIALGFVFVVILQFDEPEEWPPLFRSPLEAFTLRRFWGVFWHRLITPSATAWARSIASRLPLLRSSPTLEKLFTAFFVFTTSGLAHVLVGWRLGDKALERDLFFFWANFVAIGIEIALSRLGKRINRNPAVKLLSRMFGYAWVVGFFVLTVPHVLFPKMHYAIRAQMFARMFERTK